MFSGIGRTRASLAWPGLRSISLLLSLVLPAAFTTGAVAQTDGQHIYTQSGCSGCHGQSGGGGIGPALAGNGELSKTTMVIDQILHGGKTMPSFDGKLSNDQLAAVASYIRTSWGNDFGKVTAQQVAQVSGGGDAKSASSSKGQSSDADGDDPASSSKDSTSSGSSDQMASSSSEGGQSQAQGGMSQSKGAIPELYFDQGCIKICVGDQQCYRICAPASGSSGSMEKSSASGDNAQSKSGDSAGQSGNSESQSSEDNNDSAQADQSGEKGLAVGEVNLKSQTASTSGPNQNELIQASRRSENWLMYNKGYDNQRWSSLDQINTRNIGSLQPVCIAQLGVSSSFESSPVVYDGTLYITTPYDTFAMDAATCEMKWHHTYHPTGPEPFNTNRGIAIADGRVFRGTSDAHMLALDAKTGKLLWDARPVDSSKGYFLSAAPVVWNDEVIMGTAGADWGAPAYIFAFDTATGQQKWSFYEVKEDTFGGAEKASVGGGSNWTSFAIDPDRRLLYAPVGNPAPDFAPQYRPGKNLYTNSVIALKLDDGTLDHYYQQIPNDGLDRDTAASPVLLREVNGTTYVAATNKAGHLFLYNEKTQKLVWTAETTTIKNAETDGHQTRPTEKGVHVCPGVNGGVEWYGPAFNPQTGQLFTPSVDWCSTFTLGEVRYTPGQFFFGGSYAFDPVDQAKGRLRAFDAADGSMLWEYKSDQPLVAGVTPTAGGLLFTGELNGDLVALDQKSGKVLYRFPTGGPIAGGVSTYEVNGQQYVAAASGNSSRTWTPDSPASSTIVIFSLGNLRPAVAQK